MFLIYCLKILLILVAVILTVAFYTILERKLMAVIQHRYGPNLVGIQGGLQWLADGLKLIFKELLLPQRGFLILFLFAPLVSFFVSFWSFIILQYEIICINSININQSLLQLLVFLSINIYGIILAGQASNSRYPFIGSLRSISQLLSYELLFSLIILFFCLKSCSFIIEDVINEQLLLINIILFFPVFGIYLISILVETNRAPFDLPEAEAEIVAGYNLEYSGILFALFFLGEYASMVFLSLLGVVFFFGGQLPLFNGLDLYDGMQFQIGFKSFLFILFFILIRAVFPRCRYDQLLFLSQHDLLPFLVSFFFFLFGVVIFFIEFGNILCLIF